jgi:hypothetical protein
LAGSFQDRRIEEHNRVAVLELLAREHFLQASTLIQRYLSLPVSKYHLFILPLIRIPRLFDKDDSISAAREIARLYIDSVGVQFEPKWRERFTVEVFHTLSEISPDVLINTIGKLLDEVGEFELTAVLESVCKAARRSDAISLSKAPLKASALKLWNRYTTGVHVKDTDNRPGIMGRLLEILGRSGFEVEDLMQQIAESPIKPQILYQFVQRPLDFLATQRKLTLFMLTLQHMVETKQFFAAKRFTRDVLLPSIGPGFEEGLFRRILSPSQEETR